VFHFSEGTQFIVGRNASFEIGNVVVSPEGEAVYPPIEEVPASEMMVDNAVHKYKIAHGRFPLHILES
jgi:hypothetical protein